VTIGAMDKTVAVDSLAMEFFWDDEDILPNYAAFSWSGIPYATSYKLVIQSVSASKAVNYSQIVDGPGNVYDGLDGNPLIQTG